MSPESAVPEETSDRSPAAAAAEPQATRRHAWFLGAGLLVFLTGAGAWWGGWLHQPAPHLEPPLPGDIRDPEVREVLGEARQRVVDKPRDARLWGDYGLLLLAHLFDHEADVCFTEAARLDPKEARWPYSRGLIALKRRPDEALALLRQARALAEGDPTLHAPLRLQLAEAYQERLEIDEAEKLFLAEWHEHPGEPRSGFGLGLIALARNDLVAARKYLLAARTSPSGRKRATVKLASLLLREGDERAAGAYDREAASLPDDPPWPDPVLDELVDRMVGRRGYERRIAQLELVRRYADALKLYEVLLTRERTASYCLGAAVDQARLGRFEQAEALLEEAVRLDPDNGQVHYTLALTRFTRGEKAWARSPGSEEARAAFRQARASCQRAAELKPNIAHNYLFWGLSDKFLGEPEAALEPLARGLACQPTSSDLHLALAEVLLDTIPPDQQKLAGELARTSFTRILLARSRFAEAEHHLDVAARLNPEDPRTEAIRRRLPGGS